VSVVVVQQWAASGVDVGCSLVGETLGLGFDEYRLAEDRAPCDNFKKHSPHPLHNLQSKYTHRSDRLEGTKKQSTWYILTALTFPLPKPSFYPLKPTTTDILPRQQSSTSSLSSWSSSSQSAPRPTYTQCSLPSWTVKRTASLAYSGRLRG
jgi:hypothetical protein